MRMSKWFFETETRAEVVGVLSLTFSGISDFVRLQLVEKARRLSAYDRDVSFFAGCTQTKPWEVSI